MAFRRKSRKVIELEFITEKEEKLIYEVPYSKDLGDKLIQFAEEMEKIQDDEEKQIEYLIKAYDEMLGAGAMDKIQAEVFGGDELLLSDLTDIGFYITSEVEKKNQEIEQEYQELLFSNQTTNKYPYANPQAQKTFTIEEVQRLLNENTNKLPN